METTTTTTQKPARHAAVSALALIGFIALLLIGIGLAIYSARFFPKFSSRINGAASSLSSVFKDKDDAELKVVATTTLPLPKPVATTATTTTPKPVVTPTHTTTVVTTTTTTAPLYGNADLAVAITAVGYTEGSNTSTFVAANNVPSNKQGAVKFTVTNTGTNVSGGWKFTVNVPTVPAFTFTSPVQNSLKPGDHIDYILGFDRGNPGANRVITVQIDSDNNVIESNENNNQATSNISIYN